MQSEKKKMRKENLTTAYEIHVAERKDYVQEIPASKLHIVN